MGMMPKLSDCKCCGSVYSGDNSKTPNPNPKRFEILILSEINKFLVAIIRYPDCTNYEGVKVMVYKDIKPKELLMSEKIDPHFCDNGSCISPIARFEPSEIGIRMAYSFCQNWKW